MKHFLLFLDFDADYLKKRDAHRRSHLDYLTQGAASGLVVLGGASIDGEPMGVVICKAETKAEVERFAADDPYVTGGVATGFRVREWTTVVGAGALTKV